MEPTMHCAHPRVVGCQGRQPDSFLEAETGPRGVRRGDIVAIRYAAALAARYCQPGSDVADKRVIAVGGDRVVERDGIVSVNGRRLDEPYVPASERSHDSGSWLIPRNSLFVMGDNRKLSCDSALLGPIPRANVVGRIVEIIRPAADGSDPVGPPIEHVQFAYRGELWINAAMEPTFHCARPGRECTGAHSDLTLTELSGARAIHRGTIVTFPLPPAAKPFCGQGIATERVIGLPGEHVTEHDGMISIDGRPLSEPYVPKRERDHRSGSWHIPAQAYFVMADNRAHSCDSRFWGSVSASRVQGRVVEIIRDVAGR